MLLPNKGRSIHCKRRNGKRRIVGTRAAKRKEHTTTCWAEQLEPRILLAGDLVGDFNEDGVRDVADIDLLSADAAAGRNTPDFDINSDGLVDLADIERFLGLVGSLAGDSDLNRTVEFGDFLILSGNFGGEGVWSRGDYDADGLVSFSDFLALSGNFGETGVLSPPQVIEVAPSDGEDLVNVTREVVVQFDRPVDPTTVNQDSLYVIANGQQLSSTVAISSTGLFATLFHEPFPPATEVRVVVDGSRITGVDGIALDGDGDGEPGGIDTSDFRTLPLTRIPGTNVTGRVIASEADAEGNDVPLGGVTIRVDGFPELSAVTDADGHFVLTDVPAPVFFVHIDGSTATSAGGQPIPEGGFYPVVGKPFHSVPGQTVELEMDGEAFDVHLPFILDSAIQDIVPGQETVAMLPPEQTAGDPELEKVELTVPPDSLQRADGSMGTQVGIFRVDSDRLPAPLPPGIEHSFDITVQADANIFDVPAPIVFPNSAGLAPGEKSLLMSFDHALGAWAVVGRMTVSEDGQTVTSDPGSGVVAPGWHGQQDGSDPDPPDKPKCEDFGWGDAWTLLKALGSALKDILNLGPLVSTVIDTVSAMGDVVQRINAAIEASKSGASNQAVLQGLLAANSVKMGVVNALKNFKGAANPLGRGLRTAKAAIDLANTALGLATKCSTGPGKALANLAQKVLKFGSDVIGNLNNLQKSITGAPFAAFQIACGGLDTLLSDLAGPPPGVSVITVSTAGVDFQLPPPPPSPEELQERLAEIVAQFQEFQESFDNSAPAASESLAELQGALVELIEDGVNPLMVGIGFAQSGYWKMTLGEDFVIRGRTSSAGGYNLPAAVAAESPYLFQVYDPAQNAVAEISGTTAPSGETTRMLASDFVVTLLDETSPDQDGEGLADVAEDIIGTILTTMDTDLDQIDDQSEVEQGLDPLDGVAFPTGLIASLPLTGDAHEVVLVGSALNSGSRTAYVATGGFGLSIVDASRFDMPIVLGEIDLPGNNRDVAVDATRDLAVVAGGTAGVHLVDVSDPMLPELVETIALPFGAQRVEVFDGSAYVGSGTRLTRIELKTGEVIDSVSLGTSSLTDIARAGTHFYTMDTLNTLRVVTSELVPRGSVALPEGGGKLFVDEGVAYATAANDFRGGYTTADVSDPDAPMLISGSDVEQGFAAPKSDIIANGSGLALLAGSVFGASSVDILNASDPSETNEFLTRYDLSPSPQGIDLGSGIAFVADGRSGLQVVNYLSFDNQVTPPTIDVAALVDDVDAEEPGIQIVEGTLIPLRLQIVDDVQVRNVELLIDGQVVRNDVSPPYDFVVTAPAISSLFGETTSFTLQVCATDTGGNQTCSTTNTFGLVPDTVPPVVVSTSPDDGSRVFYTPSIDVLFNESIDGSLLDVSGVAFAYLGADGQPGGGDDENVALGSVELRSLGKRLRIFPGVPPTVAGNYQVTVEPTIIQDLAGNPIAAPISIQFALREASDIRAQLGTPTVPRAPSANPGQLIELRIPGISTTSEVVFPVINGNGSVSQRSVRPIAINQDANIGHFTVPLDAFTGDIILPVEGPDSVLPLQVVPVVTDVDLQSIANNRSVANVRLRGSGFIEGNETTYRFGDVSVVDISPSSGVNSGWFFSHENDGADVVVPTTEDNFHGAVTVTTAGGTSAPWSVGFTELQGVALSGTPADAGEASANAGQVVTIVGTGLHTGTDIIGRYVDSNGTQITQLLNPFHANLEGTTASFQLPNVYNGAFQWHLLGAAEGHLLQVVPTLDSWDVLGNNGRGRLRGTGLVENDAVYSFGGAETVDPDPANRTDVRWMFAHDNDGVDLDVPVSGLGVAQVTTAGGTSNTIPWNGIYPGLGDLRDVGFDGTHVWVGTRAGQLRRVSASTGELVGAEIPLPDGGSNGVGLQVLGSAMVLNGVNVPAGSLLVSNWNGNPDRITALSPDGTVLSTLTLAENLDPVAMTYDPADGGHLYVLRSVDPDEIVEVNTTNGTVEQRLPIPGASYPGTNAGGLTIDPVTGNFWVGGSSTPTLVEVGRDGSLVRAVDIGLQGIVGEVTGLDFGGEKLLISSVFGTVYELDLSLAGNVDLAEASFTSINTLAGDGTPASGGASANVGQAIELVGTNLNAGVFQVQFPTRDNGGNTSVTVAPLTAVSADGTRAQAIVPSLATTGEVRLVQLDDRNLGFASWADRIYRDVNLEFTASGQQCGDSIPRPKSAGGGG